MEQVFSQAMKARQDLGGAKEGRVSQYIHASNPQVVYLRLTQCYMSVFYILYLSIAGAIEGGEVILVSRWALRVGHRGEGLRNGLSIPWQPGRQPVPGLAEAMF